MPLAILSDMYQNIALETLPEKLCRRSRRSSIARRRAARRGLGGSRCDRARRCCQRRRHWARRRLTRLPCNTRPKEAAHEAAHLPA